MSAAVSLSTADESGVHEVAPRLVLTPELLASDRVVFRVYDPARDATLVSVRAGVAVWKPAGLEVRRFPYGGEEKAAKASTPERKSETPDAEDDASAIEIDGESEGEAAAEQHYAAAGPSLSYAERVEKRSKEKHEPWRTIKKEAEGIFRRRGPQRSFDADHEDFGQYVSLATWENCKRWSAKDRADPDKVKANARMIAVYTISNFRSGVRRKRDGLLDHACNGRNAESYADNVDNYDRDAAVYSGGGDDRINGTIPPVDALPPGRRDEEKPVARIERLARRGIIAEDLIIELIDRERDPERTYWNDLRLMAEIVYCEKKGIGALPLVPRHDTASVARIESSPTLAALLLLALGFRPAWVAIGTELDDVKAPLAETFKSMKARARGRSKKST